MRVTVKVPGKRPPRAVAPAATPAPIGSASGVNGLSKELTAAVNTNTGTGKDQKSKRSQKRGSLPICLKKIGHLKMRRRDLHVSPSHNPPSFVFHLFLSQSIFSPD